VNLILMNGLVPISEVPDATLRRRHKQRNYSRIQSDRRGTRRMDASAMGCEAKALRRSLPDEALSIVARALAVNSTNRSLCRTGAMPHDLGSAANAF
jgi:hypothetical protein